MDIKSNRRLLNYLNSKVISVVGVLCWIVFILYNDIEVANNRRAMMLFVGLIIGIVIKLSIDELNKILLLSRLNKIIEIIDDLDESKSIKDFNKGGIYDLLNKNEITYKNIDLIIESSKKAKSEKVKTEVLYHNLINNTALNLKNPVKNLLDESLGLVGDRHSDSIILDSLESDANNIKILINTLFEGVKIISGVAQSEKIEVDINYVLKQCLIEMEGTFERQNLILYRVIDCKKRIVVANPEQLWRVFQILIENIIKHPWRSSGYESSLLIGLFLLFTYLVIPLMVNILRSKFFEITMGNMSKAINNGTIKDVIDNLSLEGESYRIWGQGYSVAYKEVIEILEKLNKSKIEENIAMKERIEFITNSSHDIKTPLTSIINYIDILKNKEITEEERVKFTRDLKRRISILNDLIDDLNYSMELSKENICINYENINIEELLEEIINFSKNQLIKKGIYIKKHVSIDNKSVKLDKKATSRVFQNIIENILKYGKLGSDVFIEIYDTYKEIKKRKDLRLFSFLFYFSANIIGVSGINFA